MYLTIFYKIYIIYIYIYLLIYYTAQATSRKITCSDWLRCNIVVSIPRRDQGARTPGKFFIFCIPQKWFSCILRALFLYFRLWNSIVSNQWILWILSTNAYISTFPRKSKFSDKIFCGEGGGGGGGGSSPPAPTSFLSYLEEL